MKPMKGFKWNDVKSSFPFPCHLQPKLNGVRALYRLGTFQSYDCQIWNRPVIEHFLHELQLTCPPHILLDGEFYLHGKSLQQINGAMSVKRTSPGALTPLIEYHVFDCVDTNDLHLHFSERLQILDSFRDRLVAVGAQKIKVVPTTLIPEPGLDETLFGVYRAGGFEGTMYRNSNSPYGFLEECGNKENRWKWLIKRKEWEAEEFEIISFEETTGEKGHGGFQLHCKTDSGARFAVGSGLSKEEVAHYAANPPGGLQARIRYECLSDGGIPLKPTIEAILE